MINLIKGYHLTALDKKLINASIKNNYQDVHTKRKRLNIICIDNDKNVKANLWSYENGIGIGSPMRWQKQEIQFKTL